MDIRVAGHQVDTGEALRSHVSDRLSAIADRYFSRAVAANVTFGRGPYEDFTCDIVAPVNQGVVLKSSNRANDAHIAFDGAADKIEKQLKRYMDRLRDRRGEADGAGVSQDAAYTVFRLLRTRKSRSRRLPLSSPKRGWTSPMRAYPTR